MKSNEAKSHIVGVCKKVIETFAAQKNVEQQNLRVRIDLENKVAKPVFGLFEKSRLICPCSQTEIIHAGGGKGLGMVIGVYVRNFVLDIFKAALMRFERTDTKEFFVLLYLKEIESELVPMLAIYKQNQFMDAIPVGNLFADKE